MKRTRKSYITYPHVSTVNTTDFVYKKRNYNDRSIYTRFPLEIESNQSTNIYICIRQRRIVFCYVGVHANCFSPINLNISDAGGDSEAISLEKDKQIYIYMFNNEAKDNKIIVRTDRRGIKQNEIISTMQKEK